MTKILCIGNSFSQDATYYLHTLATSAGLDIKVVNLCIAGCSLETHAKNIKENLPAYYCEINARGIDRTVSLQETVEAEDFDIVTVQQVSGLSGIYESYQGHFQCVLDFIRSKQPKAKIYFHKTWAYEIDSTHGCFAAYGCNQDTMYNAICGTAERLCAENGNLPVIPSGDVIQALRKTPLFDYENGGLSLCRDGFHMNLLYGRYAVAAVWLETLFGCNIYDVPYLPVKEDIVGIEYNGTDAVCDPAKVEIIRDTVHKTVNKL